MVEEIASPPPIKLAVAAVGGQGGGVLAQWLVDVAESENYLAQMTSVPGVAQRTGATIYYLEFVGRAAVGDREPVFALYPVPGDVDVVIATELIEAGRVILRGFVTPERTALIASTHREYTIEEKIALGDGRRNSADVLEIAGRAAKRLLHLDMAAEAKRTRSVISSVALGAVAGARVLPFTRTTYEEVIRAGGLAVEANLAGFEAGYAAVNSRETTVSVPPPEAPTDGSSAKVASAPLAVQPLLLRIEKDFPPSVRAMLREGLRRVVDYQDARYGEAYLERLSAVLALDREYGGEHHGYRLTGEVARYLALWMSYEDTIRVADLKTRRGRFDRVRREVRAGPRELVYVTEFMHPRVEELCDTLPAPIGRYILASPRLRRITARLVSRGWFVGTFKLSGFLLLYATASLRRWRRLSLRFVTEQARIDQWLRHIERALPGSYELAVEITECARLIKGYGDTHARGLKNYDTIVAALESLPLDDAAARAARQLRQAALADEDGRALRRALEEVARGPCGHADDRAIPAAAGKNRTA